MYHPDKQAGFALLISLLVVGVVISVGLSILDLSSKQVRLSSNAKESELAFHAANAGMECARYWRREYDSFIINGIALDPIPRCFNETADTNILTNITSTNVTGDGWAYRYQFDFTWGSGTEMRCTKVNMVVGVVEVDRLDLTITGMNTLIPGYPSSEKRCGVGARCTVVSVQGYNLPCANTGGYGVVQREVLLEY